MKKLFRTSIIKIRFDSADEINNSWDSGTYYLHIYVDESKNNFEESYNPFEIILVTLTIL